ncbi:MAG: glycosyl hydrolase [Melioribacteraceae bacterium]
MKKNLTAVVILFFICTNVFPQNFRVLNYLKSISGKQTIAGQHNREPNSTPAKWTDEIYKTTGKFPALWSGDFLFQADNIKNRWTMIFEAKKQWDKGAIVQIMLHTCPPIYGEPCGWDGGVLSKLSATQWNELLTEGTTINSNWKKRLDDIAVYLYYLKVNGVEVLFRPLHEMNQGAFWWGGRTGPNGTLRLYQITHDYLTKVKGLTNLIWVWDVQDMSWDFDKYNPGDEYWDIMAFDVYSDGFNKKWYDYILTIAKDKPIAIGECEKLPSIAMLQQQPRWVFFMAWAELVYSKNTNAEIQAVYNGQNVVTLNEMPGWPATAIEEEKEIPSDIKLEQNYPNPFNPETTISYKLQKPSKVSLKVYDMFGREIATLVDEYKPVGNYNLQFSIRNSELASGVYYYRLTAGNYSETKSMMLMK